MSECPNCPYVLVQPEGSKAYCSHCGWGTANFGIEREPTIEETMREAARINGNDPEVAIDELQKLDMCFEMAQNMQLAFLERCNDIGVNPLHGLLSIYNLTRFQINANLKRGNISRKDIRAMRFASELCRMLRHPDGEYPMMVMNADGNFVRSGTHTETETNAQAPKE